MSVKRHDKVVKIMTNFIWFHSMVNKIAVMKLGLILVG